MCRSYHTGRDHPACDAVLRSPSGIFRWHAPQTTPRTGAVPSLLLPGNFALTELIASSTCWRSAVSLPVFRNCIIEPNQLEQALF
jgi:hypothetical protein